MLPAEPEVQFVGTNVLSVVQATLDKLVVMMMVSALVSTVVKAADVFSVDNPVKEEHF